MVNNDVTYGELCDKYIVKLIPKERQKCAECKNFVYTDSKCGRCEVKMTPIDKANLRPHSATACRKFFEER